MTCWICPLAELSWHPPEVAAAAGEAPPEPTASAVATTLATVARLDSLRQRLAFTYALRFQTGEPGTPQASVDCRRAGGRLQVESRRAALTGRAQPALSG